MIAFTRKTRPVIAAMAMMGTLALAAPAYADQDGHRGDRDGREWHDEGRYGGDRYDHDEWRRHEREAEYWHHHHPVPPPHVIYAPPTVVYAPPPPPFSGITLILPLDIR